MSHDGKVAWESTLDFTLRQCVVGADGTTAGYAYATWKIGSREVQFWALPN